MHLHSLTLLTWHWIRIAEDYSRIHRFSLLTLLTWDWIRIAEGYSRIHRFSLLTLLTWDWIKMAEGYSGMLVHSFSLGARFMFQRITVSNWKGFFFVFTCIICIVALVLSAEFLHELYIHCHSLTLLTWGRIRIAEGYSRIHRFSLLTLLTWDWIEMGKGYSRIHRFYLGTRFVFQRIAVSNWKGFLFVCLFFICIICIFASTLTLSAEFLHEQFTAFINTTDMRLNKDSWGLFQNAQVFFRNHISVSKQCCFKLNFFFFFIYIICIFGLSLSLFDDFLHECSTAFVNTHDMRLDKEVKGYSRIEPDFMFHLTGQKSHYPPGNHHASYL